MEQMMAHWKHDVEREDGDGHDETRDAAVNARKWLRGEADRSRDPFIRGLMSDLRQLEESAAPFFLGLDYDDDTDDVDDVGPF